MCCRRVPVIVPVPIKDARGAAMSANGKVVDQPGHRIGDGATVFSY
jgi:hypothetical protein